MFFDIDVIPDVLPTLSIFISVIARGLEDGGRNKEFGGAQCVDLGFRCCSTMV